jgi:hypothetical protein
MSASWAHPTWSFLHTLFENIPNSHFLANKTTILNYLSGMLRLLPCPDCANHASTYLSRNKLENIKSVTDGRQFFFRFHNDVNRRLRKSLFDINKLTIYKNRSISEEYKKHTSIFYAKSMSRNILFSHHRNNLYKQYNKGLMDIFRGF